MQAGPAPTQPQTNIPNTPATNVQTALAQQAPTPSTQAQAPVQVAPAQTPAPQQPQVATQNNAQHLRLRQYRLHKLKQTKPLRLRLLKQLKHQTRINLMRQRWLEFRQLPKVCNLMRLNWLAIIQITQILNKHHQLAALSSRVAEALHNRHYSLAFPN